jgi:hypothetical protein
MVRDRYNDGDNEIESIRSVKVKQDILDGHALKYFLSLLSIYECDIDYESTSFADEIVKLKGENVVLVGLPHPSPNPQRIILEMCGFFFYLVNNNNVDLDYNGECNSGYYQGHGLFEKNILDSNICTLLTNLLKI